MNYPTLLWVALAVYSLIRVARYRRMRRMERACQLLRHVAQRYSTIMEDQEP